MQAQRLDRMRYITASEEHYQVSHFDHENMEGEPFHMMDLEFGSPRYFYRCWTPFDSFLSRQRRLLFEQNARGDHL